ncbi:hypothetical protein DFH09DRAFT_1103589 [Mycena vulgaris]|nr:hypothetical protein DFH09DRAFT_1103589 [Mycena vulgaris]
MLIEVPDDDAAVLFQSLPSYQPSQPSTSPRQDALHRLRQNIAKEGHRLQLSWVLDSNSHPEVPFPVQDIVRTQLSYADGPVLQDLRFLRSRPSDEAPAFTESAPAAAPGLVEPFKFSAPALNNGTSTATETALMPSTPQPLLTPPPTSPRVSPAQPTPSSSIAPRLLSPLRIPNPTLFLEEDDDMELTPPASPEATLVGSSPSKPADSRKRTAVEAQILEDSSPTKRGCRGGGKQLERDAARALNDFLAGEGAEEDDEEDDGDDDDGEYQAEAHASGLGRGRGRGRGRRRGTGTRLWKPQHVLLHRFSRDWKQGTHSTGPMMKQDLQTSKVPLPGLEKTQWTNQGAPPTLTEASSRLIVQLSYVSTSVDKKNSLLDLLLTLSDPSSSSPSPSSSSSAHPIALLAGRCDVLETQSVVVNFQLMLSYMELALYIQRLRKNPNVPTSSRTTEVLAENCNSPAINGARLQKWYGYGSRLIYLAAAATMYIIPLIAAAGAKSVFLKANKTAIEGLVFTLLHPEVPDGSQKLGPASGALVRHHIIPQLALLRHWGSNLENTHFRILIPLTDDDASTYLPFGELKGVHSALSSFDVNFYKHVYADPAWALLAQAPVVSALPQMSKPVDDSCIAEEIRIDIPIDLQRTSCPVTLETTREWTNLERPKALNAVEVIMFPTSKTRYFQPFSVQTFYENGVKKPDSYLLIDTKISEGNVLHFRGKNNKFLALVATNLKESIPNHETFIDQLAGVMVGEIFEDVSSRVDFSYLAWHCSYYNRYAEQSVTIEQGTTAPKDTHPNFVRKLERNKLTFRKERPWPPKKSSKIPKVKRFLPEEYLEIKIYVTKLPLNERSAAHPFGGFVINISARTDAHRDIFDKLFCIVIPFGRWKGGELCLYELGFVFRLHPWDMLVFPSCDITHFNLDFEGTRLSIVLHSDKSGDKWVQTGNGWVARFVNFTTDKTGPRVLGLSGDLKRNYLAPKLSQRMTEPVMIPGSWAQRLMRALQQTLKVSLLEDLALDFTIPGNDRTWS